jgi:RNA polymerase sigma-70 factor, ECF subfamily
MLYRPVSELVRNPNDVSASAEFVAQLLRLAQEGDREAESKLFDLLYKDMRRLAAWTLRNQKSDHSLTPSGLVNEAYLRLFGRTPPDINDRHHFFAICCRVMRRILVDRARKRMRQKRNFDATVSLNGMDIGWNYQPEEVIAIHGALSKLAAHHPRAACIVEMRFFGGLEDAEIASILNTTVRTIQRDWRLSKTLLQEALRSAAPDRES